MICQKSADSLIIHMIYYIYKMYSMHGSLVYDDGCTRFDYKTFDSIEIQFTLGTK